MPSRFSVDSRICGHKTNITATRKENYWVSLEIKSTCRMVNDYASLLKEIHQKDIGRVMVNNPIFIKASEARIHSNCLVPSGVAFAAWTEAQMIAMSLLSHHRSQCIEYEAAGP